MLPYIPNCACCEQIFYNLIGNSCKFTHKGTISISAAALFDSNQMEITVSGGPSSLLLTLQASPYC